MAWDSTHLVRTTPVCFKSMRMVITMIMMMMIMWESVSQFIVVDAARSLKEALVFYIFERDFEKGRHRNRTEVLFFPGCRHPKTNTKAKRKERLVASISLFLHELNIQKSNLNKTTRKREETYLNWFGSARWKYPRKTERLDRWQFCDLLFSVGSVGPSVRMPKKMVVETLLPFQRWQKTRAWFGCVDDIAFVACASTNSSSSSSSSWTGWLMSVSRTLWFLFWRRKVRARARSQRIFVAKRCGTVSSRLTVWHVLHVEMDGGRQKERFFGEKKIWRKKKQSGRFKFRRCRMTHSKKTTQTHTHADTLNTHSHESHLRNSISIPKII